tara:strand:+ start:1442 stop:2728 length:1287 start_codon:yes stop_codon:yes gene_type:complete
MSFLNEVTYNIQSGEAVPNTVKPDDTVNIGDSSMEEKKGRDLDGDGDVDSNDYLAARNAAIKKAKSMKESVAKDLYIKAMESSSLEEFLSDVYQDYPQHKDNSDIADYLKNYYLNAGGPLNEGSLKSLLVALGIGAASVGLLKKLDASDPVVKAIKTAQEKGLVDTPAEKKAAKDMLLRRGVWLDTGRGEGGDLTIANVNKALKEAKTIELPADTTFTVDLKHLMKKHMAEGKSKEEAITFTKKLMAKLHDKGELTVDGTKIVFKEGKKKSGYMGYTEFAEADIPQDTPLALPEPDAQDFLGDDGMDYEGGMAKSQMLKMKKYVMALNNMIDDESQLESWVQAKLTKASDYMSSVYHYLDYQKSKMNEGRLQFALNGQEVIPNGTPDGELNAYYKNSEKDLTPDEIDTLINTYEADFEVGGAYWETLR